MPRLTKISVLVPPSPCPRSPGTHAPPPRRCPAARPARRACGRSAPAAPRAGRPRPGASGLCASRMTFGDAPRSTCAMSLDPARPVTDAGEVERLAADRQPRARIPQHDGARALSAAGMSRSSSWLPRTAIDPVRRRQRRQRFGGRDDEMPVAPGDVVAAEHHEIRRLASSAAGRSRDQLVRHRVAAMEIRDEADAQPGERLRQARDVHRLAGQPEMMALVDVPVREGSGRGADAGGRDPFSRSRLLNPRDFDEGGIRRYVSAPRCGSAAGTRLPRHTGRPSTAPQVIECGPRWIPPSTIMNRR